MWKKLLITGCVTFSLLSGGTLSAQPSCEIKEEVTSEQLDRTQKELVAMMKELKNDSYFQTELDKAAVQSSLSKRMAAYKDLTVRLLSVLEIQAELEWMKPEAIQEALGIMKKSSGFDAVLADKRFGELKSLLAGGFDGIYTGDAQAIDKANKTLTLKRKLMLMSPDVNVDKMLTVKFDLGERANFVGAGSLGIQPNNWSNLSSASRKNFKAQLVELSGLQSGELSEKVLYKPAVDGSSVTDLVLNWDGKRLMFTALDTTRRWQVHELDINNGEAKQVTNIPEPDLEFFDGTYLPDGRMLAISNIGYQGVPCVNGSDAVGNMVLYDPSNGYLRRLTFDQDANWHPVVMANGKVMYVRWEYTDLTHYFSRIVMHMNPDGTEQKSLYGSGSMFPNSIFDVQPLPKHTNRFVGVISGHHGVARSGRLMIFDPAKSRKEEKGMIQELPFRGRPIIPEVKDELVNGVWPQFIKPYPLTDETFLVTAKLSPYSRWGIYLVDIYDNLTLVANADDAGMIYSVPVKSTPIPPAIPDRIKPNEKEATVFIQDVYEGEGLRGVPRGEIKSFRVYAYEYAYRRTLSDHYNHGIQAGWDIKRLLGTVPVEKAGSAIFKIPANTPVSLHPLDKNGRAVQWMRSWLTGMPGEVVSCVGCHEDQNTIPVPKRVQASTRQPHELKIAEGGVRPYTFAYEIQPILDRACVACHDGSKPERPNFKDTTSVGITDWSGTRYFQKSYLAFHPYVNRQGPEADMYVMSPYEYHASTSEIVRMLERGHHNVKLTDNEWEHLVMWIDMNAPGRGTFDADLLNGYDQYTRRKELADKYGNAGVDWRKELADYASYLKGKGEICPAMPEKVTSAKHKAVKMKRWPLTAEDIQNLLSKETGLRKDVEVADGVKITFVRVPAGKFVMGTNDAYPDQAPAFKAEVKKGFWMSEKELTNEQYNALVPEHDSRIYAQFWKDHTTPGYPANKPNQPVIRVSYEEAMKYCDILSEKTGLKVTLPTEVQWEWACRGGSAQPFWYGAMDANFGSYENLADVQLEKMAVTGIDPQPMAKDNPWFPYYNYLPKVETVNDGMMIPSDGYNYRPNPFGLINMHGNLQEWTRSLYAPYPYSEKAQATADTRQVVARGGSWIDRPKDATATARRVYLPWQRVNNVGLRLIIED